MGNVILFPNNTSTGSVSVASNVKKISYTPTSGVSFISFRVGCYRSGTTAHYKNIKVCLASDPYTEWTPYAPTNSQLLSYKDNGVLGAKNLFHLSSITNTSADITTVDNGDGTVTVSGTPTSSLTFFLKSDRPLEAGQYNFSGLAGTTNLSIYKLYLYNGNTVIKEVLGTSITVVSSDVHTEVRVAVKNIDNNVAVSGTIKPMIRLASDTDPTYQPYAMTNKELSEEEEITIGTAPAPTLTIKRFGKVCNFYAKYNGLDDTAGQILIGTITNSKFIPKYGYAIAPLYDVSIQQSYAPKGSMWINSENGKVYLYKPTADTSGYVMGTYIAN